MMRASVSGNLSRIRIILRRLQDTSIVERTRNWQRKAKATEGPRESTRSSRFADKINTRLSCKGFRLKEVDRFRRNVK